jgi:CCR4-NOT transcription complex subunit 1
MFADARTLQVMSGIQIDERIVDEATIVIASENLDLGCNLIEKAAAEKANREIDGHLDLALKGLGTAKTRSNEEWVQGQQWMRILPESLRPKSGAALAQQAHVYEDFARLPRERLAAQAAQAGVQPPPGGGASGLPLSVPSDKALRQFEQGPVAGMPPQAGAGGGDGMSRGDAMSYGGGDAMSYPMQQAQDQLRAALEKCATCLAKAEEMVMRNPLIAAATLNTLPQHNDMKQLLMHSLAVVQQSGNKDEVALAYAQRLFRRIYDTSKFGTCPLGVDFLCASLTLLAQAEGGKRLHKQLLAWVLLENENRLNRDLTVALVQHRLLHLNAPEYVSTMAKAMDLGRSTAAVDTVVWIVQQCLVEKRLVSTSDCAALLDALAKVAQNLRKAPDHLVKLLETARNLARGTAAPPAGAGMGAAANMAPPASMAGLGAKGKDAPDPPGLHDQVAKVLDMWTMQVHTNDDRAVIQCMTMIIQQGWMKGDDTTERFFRLIIQIAMQRCSAAGADPNARGAIVYAQADSVCKLMRCLVSYHDEWSRGASGLPPTSLTKQSLINKWLAAFVRVIINEVYVFLSVGLF